MYILLKVEKIRMFDGIFNESDVHTRLNTVEINASYGADIGYVRLDTGEVFTNPDSINTLPKGLPIIGCTASFLPTDIGDEIKSSRLEYFNGFSSDDVRAPSWISVSCFITHDLFSSLIANLRSGIYPSHIELRLQNYVMSENNIKPFTFGMAPDGSEIYWHNIKHNRLPILDFRFIYSVL